MKKILIVAFLFLAATSLQAQITSTFDTDADGWVALYNVGTVATSTYQSSGGNPGGFMSAAPPTAGGSVNTSMAWYWQAPAKFLGQHDLSFGQLLEFDLIQSVAGTDNTVSDVVVGGPSGATLHYTFPQKPQTSWTSYSIPLDNTADWRYGGKTGAVASKYQIKYILSNVTGLWMRCKYINSAGYTCGIDNVRLGVRSLQAAPKVSSFTPTSALPGAEVTITGNNFGATPAKNIVYFGNVKASILSADATQIKVMVPSGATEAPIAVINSDLSLVGSSSDNFLPLSMSDPDLIGHIIPATFDTNVIMPYADYNDNGLAGANLGDIDNDGRLDIIAFEDGQDKFAIFLNQGQAGDITTTSFASKVEIPSGELAQLNSSSTLLADFDNDGKIDIATFFRGTYAEPSGVAVSRNISTPGNVLFEPAVRCQSIGISIGGLDATDVDGDGRIDLLVTSGNFYIGKNISTPGKIEFATFRSYAALGGSVSTGDINDDGKDEIVVIGSNSFSIFENQSTPGNIALAAPVTLPGSVVSGVTLADVDSDNKSDIVYYRINGFNDYDLVIRKNNYSTGAIDANAFGADVLISKIGRAYSQRVVDLNGDKKPEILIGYYPNNSGFVVFENITPPGTIDTQSFLPEVYFEETATGTFEIPLVGDLNADNQPDIIGFGSSDGGEHSVIIYQNKCIAPPHIAIHTVTPLKGPVGSIVTITGEKFSTDPASNSVTFGSVKANVLTATKTELTVEVPQGAIYERISVTRNFMTSRYHLPFNVTFSPGTTFDATTFLAPVNYPLTGADYDVEVSDLNDDGKPDVLAESIVVTGVVTNYGVSFRNDFTTGPISTSTLVKEDSTNASAPNPRIFDVDEDGKPDIVSQSALFRNTTTPAKIGFQNGIGGIGGTFFAWTDFDLDGKTDLISVNGGNVQMYRNHSRPRPFRTAPFGTLAPTINFAKGGTGGGVVAADFDGDGNPEFASSNPDTDNIRVWRNTGGFPLAAAMFTVAGDFPAGDTPGRLYAADLDVDGKMDLAVYHNTGTASAQISVLHNTSTTGNISFTKVDYALGGNGTTMTIDDLDGDGRPEMIVAGETTNRVSVFKNMSTPGVIDAASFGAPFHYTVSGARGITTGDLNADSKPEIIVTRAGNILSILENAVPSGPTITIDTQPTFTYACEGETAIFNIDASGTTNITCQWQKYDGTSFADINDGSGYSGTATKTLSINTSVTGFSGNGNYRCRVNGDLALEVFTDQAQLTVNGLPSPPDVTGDTECTSPATLTLTANGASDGDYNWYDVATGGAVLGTNGSFTTPSITSTRTYYVSIEDTFCESARVPVDATISLLAKPGINSSEPVVSGGVNICDGEGCTLTAPVGFVTYAWSNGETGQQIIVDQTGVYSVVVEDAGGCVSPSSDPVTVTVNPFPAATITVNGAELSASPGDRYQWYQNGDAVASGTSQTFAFSLLEYGIYAVDVTDNGCTTTSDDFVYLITSGEQNTDGLKIYPNPFTTQLTIESTARETAIKLFDMLGRMVKEQHGTSAAPVRMEGISKGPYILVVESGGKRIYFKVVKAE